MPGFTQADALDIEARGKRILADEYDAAQERGEVQRRGGDGTSKVEVPTARDAGLTHKVLHDARLIRDAEEADPGVVRRVREDGENEVGISTSTVARRAGALSRRPDPRRTPPW